MGLDGGQGRAVYVRGDKAILTGPIAAAGSGCCNSRVVVVSDAGMMEAEVAVVTREARKVLRSGSAGTAEAFSTTLREVGDGFDAA